MWNKLKQWLHPDHITRSSIKEGFDDLPAAVCYFTPDGIIRLCNRQMFRVYRALSGRDLQSLEELHQQVWAPTHGRRVDGKNPSFVLPDGTCWLYSEQTVFGEGGRPHVECIFSEVTDLQRQRQELLRQNQELLRMNRELRRLSENVQEMTREKEIMAFKTRLHDEMGYGLTAVRQCLLQRKDSAELEASLEQMNKAVQLFRKDSEALPEENEWDVFVEDAAQLGVTVALQGPMPRQHQHLLLTIARECITNAVRYAHGSDDDDFGLRVPGLDLCRHVNAVPAALGAHIHQHQIHGVPGALGQRHFRCAQGGHPAVAAAVLHKVLHVLPGHPLVFHDQNAGHIVSSFGRFTHSR